MEFLMISGMEIPRWWIEHISFWSLFISRWAIFGWFLPSGVGVHVGGPLSFFWRSWRYRTARFIFFCQLFPLHKHDTQQTRHSHPPSYNLTPRRISCFTKSYDMI